MHKYRLALLCSVGQFHITIELFEDDIENSTEYFEYIATTFNSTYLYSEHLGVS